MPVKEIKEEKETKKKSVEIPETAGSNLVGVDMAKKSGKMPVFEVDLDNSEVEILELLENSESHIELKFTAGLMPKFADTTIRMFNNKSLMNYMLEKKVQDAMEKKDRLIRDDEYIESAIEILSEPEFTKKFHVSSEDQEKYNSNEYVFMNKRPEEVAEYERTLGFKSLGTIEGTPVGAPGTARASENMVRMVAPKKVIEALERRSQKLSQQMIRKTPEAANTRTSFLERADTGGNETIRE